MLDFLSPADKQRASGVFLELFALGFEGALTGGLAIETRLGAQGYPVEEKPLNDLDFVVEGFPALPDSLADRFLVSHVHPQAAEGKLLVQLIDQSRALRIDFFRPFGATLQRAGLVGGRKVISLPDLLARMTSMVLGCLRNGKPVDPKYAGSFQRLQSTCRPADCASAWNDHRQENSENWEEAIQLTNRLITVRKDLIVEERYSADDSSCPRCQRYGRLVPASARAVIQILGYR